MQRNEHPEIQDAHLLCTALLLARVLNRLSPSIQPERDLASGSRSMIVAFNNSVLRSDLASQGRKLTMAPLPRPQVLPHSIWTVRDRIAYRIYRESQDQTFMDRSCHVVIDT